jgi:hypothetical protein
MKSGKITSVRAMMGSAWTPLAIMAATDTMPPSSRTFR